MLSYHTAIRSHHSNAVGITSHNKPSRLYRYIIGTQDGMIVGREQCPSNEESIMDAAEMIPANFVDAASDVAPKVYQKVNEYFGRFSECLILISDNLELDERSFEVVTWCHWFRFEFAARGIFRASSEWAPIFLASGGSIFGIWIFGWRQTRLTTHDWRVESNESLLFAFFRPQNQ
mmetsp:Transcript_30904/g.74249  ORF Transcript_30904/g.74249 Transcript_30904/m.74249 type:complete len:176 (-) Transcript_30904:2620-3147(-)